MANGTIYHVNDSGWIEWKPSTIKEGFFYRKVGKQIYFQGNYFKLASALPANTEINLGNLPSGYRPSKHVTIIGRVDNSFGTITIGSDGNVFVRSFPINIEETTNIWFSGSFITQ